MKNTPDYYAILNVKSGASLQEIKASYRRLMVAMKKHPDLGGDHECAAQINEAYEVLSDDAKRKEYVRAAFFRDAKKARDSAQTATRQNANRTDTKHPAVAATLPPLPLAGTTGATVRHCPVCKVLSIQPVKPEMRCQSCHSPLSPPPTIDQLEREVGDRRLTLRTSKNNPGTIYPPGRPWGLPVNMRDLSLAGMSFYSKIRVEPGQVLRFRDSTLDAIISVVSCRQRGEKYSIHARLVTAAFKLKEGVFVSATG